MKTILVDAIHTFVDTKGVIHTRLHRLLETYPNPKLILTNANDEECEQYGLNTLPYPVFTRKHEPNKIDPRYFEMLLQEHHFAAEDVVYVEHDMKAVQSARTVGIETLYYDVEASDISEVETFLDKTLL